MAKKKQAAAKQVRASSIEVENLIQLLEHPRSLFEYHAAQRFDTINHFFVAYAIFTAAYVATFTEALSEAGYAKWLRCGLAVIAFFVTAVFWALDFRNAKLVDIDEFCQEQIEEEIADKPGLHFFGLVDDWRKPNRFKNKFNKFELWLWERLQYRVIMPVMYGAFLIISSVAAVLPFHLPVPTTAPTVCGL